jgi:hypothetical protein
MMLSVDSDFMEIKVKILYMYTSNLSNVKV